MREAIPDSLLARLSDLAAKRFGLHFPPGKWPNLARRAHAFFEDHGYEPPVSGWEPLFREGMPAGHIDALADYLTVGETYFFREKRTLDILSERIVPSLTMANYGTTGPITIWSAGCATGEEPYSIAIVLDEKVPGSIDGRVSIFGTDLNTRSFRPLPRVCTASGRFAPRR
jgi:chemotaxis protein methyltransferase CheR